ncbi:MAG: peptide chain release factor N(5)-glutamine methyltransferase, partial [Gemmatimonadetes bacterium]|nr:peptide chain release factor N(5)-glutamine methyltransferase [Gemmatimonadota bacterium]
RGDGLTGLDVGTGTGVVALSLLKEGPFSRVVATDDSPQALTLALENAGDHHLTDSVEFREGTLFEPLRGEERFDVIVSNPPYIAEEDRESLQPEVLDWEPHGALFAGPEGLDILLPLVEGAPRFLNPGGLFAAEIGEGQGERMVTALEGTGAFQTISVRPDLAGRERVILGVASS